MTSIKSIRIAGFRSLKDVTLEPGRVTVLIGANGAGKSNVLSALRMLHAIQARTLRVFVGTAGGSSALLHYGPKTTPALTLTVELVDAGDPLTFSVELGHAADDSLVFLEERVTDGAVILRDSGHREAVVGLADHADHPLARMRRLLGRIGAFHFHDTSKDSRLRASSRQEDARRLHPDGGNLAAYLYMIANATGQAYRVSWNLINSLVNRIAPFIARLEPVLATPDQREASAVRLNWIDETGTEFGVHHLSDGTLRTIALITALAQPIELLPAFITIDEPELGLHPMAISLFAALVHSISHHSQVLIATQSPALLDEFAPADVVVVGRKDNSTVLDRLEPAKLATWLENYTLSELWDKNLIGGLP